MLRCEKPPRYQAYMLRFWEVRSEQPDVPATWRFSLEDPREMGRQGFPDLESLVDFLRARIDQVDNVRSDRLEDEWNV